MNKFIQSFSIVSLISILTRFISFLFGIYLSRTLGAELMGVYQISVSLFILLSCLSTSGIPATLSRMIAENRSQTTQFSIFTSTIILSLALSIIPMAFLFSCPSLLDLIYKDKRCVNILLIKLPMLVTEAIYATIRGYFWGMKNYKFFATSELIEELTKVIISYLLFTFLAGTIIDKLYVYAVSMLVADIIVITYLIIVFFKKGGSIKKPLYINEIAKSSTPITISRLLGAILATFVSITLPNLLINNFGYTSSEAASEFGRATAMVMPLIFAPNSILSSLNIILIPEIASLASQKNKAAISSKINKSYMMTMLISSIFMLFYIALGKEIGLFIYKDQKVGLYLSFACIMIIPIGINGVLSSALNSIKKEFLTFISFAISALFLIACIYLTPKYLGIYSYFVAFIAFYFSNMLINTIFINKYIHIEIKTILISFVILLISAFIGFILKKISTTIKLNPITSIFIVGIIGLSFILIVGLLILLFTKKHKLSSILTLKRTFKT